MKKIILLFAIAAVAFSCKSDDDSPQPEVLGCTDSSSLNYNPDANTDDGTCIYEKNVTFSFTQNWGGTPVTSENYNTNVYENAAGNFVSIGRLRYLISHIVLHKTDSTLVYGDYQLIDMADAGSLTLSPSATILTGDYTGISFVYGFNEEENISGAYPDLNAADWSWPSMLGGGYHFMQMDGTFDDEMGQPQPYNFHNGTARVSEGVFEQNFITFDFDRDFTITGDATIEIKMDISEWYKNPLTWDLNERSTDLMMNYLAQKDMNRNGKTVFSIGDITQ